MDYGNAHREGKECPMCGEFMRLVMREQHRARPRLAETSHALVAEWICPDCDYFEDADDD